MVMLTIRVEPGEEVVDTVTRRLAEYGVTSGAIVSVVGAVDSCTISNMPTGDASSDILTELSQPFELSGTGEVKDGMPHIHCVISGEGNAALAGHFHRGHVRTWFVDVYVIPNEA
jgi:predicted DNA-binding protein with PD1-like motif